MHQIEENAGGEGDGIEAGVIVDRTGEPAANCHAQAAEQQQRTIRSLLKLFDLWLLEVLRWQMLPPVGVVEDAKGQRFTITYTNVRREPIPDSTYEFSVPPGTKVSTPLGS